MNRVVNKLIYFFDFAEKILLPNLINKPDQLHFITGLKFDFFGVRLSNISTTHIHCLPEVHWPDHKTANEVTSMLQFSLDYMKLKCKSTSAKKINCNSR